MAILDIALMGNPVLARPAALIEDPGEPWLVELVGQMRDTMAAAGGVGLAAPQISRSVQLVVFEVPAERTAEGQGVGPTLLINPLIEALDDAVDEAYEACLSAPGLTGLVPRWRHIGYRAIGLDGKIIEREARGFHARVVQHECDHLQGRLYLARMRNLASLAYSDELRRLTQAEEVRNEQPA